jgi:hypothetical protein
VALPIIFIHRGACRYLPASIAQARQSSPGSEFFVLGDRFNAGFCGARHFESAAYWDMAEKFAAVYQHRSSHEVDYELFCFQRWFVLLSFMRSRQLEACLYLDSDVLLFADATGEARVFEGCDVTLSLTSPHCLFFNRRESLERFCNFVMECYTTPALFAVLEEEFTSRQARNAPGGVCDMRVFGLFEKMGRGKAGDLREIRDGATYDHAMGQSNGYEMRNGIKRVEWRDGRPWCRQEATGEMVRFNALHFQGSTKRFMHAHLRIASPKLKLLLLANRVMAERGKLWQKIRGRRG